MGAWGYTFDGNDTAADWFANCFVGSDIDKNIAFALQHRDNYDQCRAAVYLLTVLGASSYVWPGDLDLLSGHVARAVSLMENMLDPAHESHQELVALWGPGSPVFAEIRRELDALKASHRLS